MDGVHHDPDIFVSFSVFQRQKFADANVSDIRSCFC